jgi:hypothetical protein
VADVGAPAGLRVHDLRHHAATTFARKPDITLKELMATLGHASPVAALRYQHATEERGRALADYMDRIIAGAGKPPKVAEAAITDLGGRSRTQTVDGMETGCPLRPSTKKGL